MEIDSLLHALLLARGPGGQEDEVRHICLRELARHCDETRIDRAGNVLGVLRATQPCEPEQSIRLMAHMDEIAMIVKRVKTDGTLEVLALGGAQPISFGVCPVELLGDQQCLPGVLSYGSMHNSGRSTNGREVLSGDVHWQDVHVVTRQDTAALERAGIRPGTRVVLSRHWRQPYAVNDCIAAHFLDDRAPVAALLGCARDLKARRAGLRQDVWFVFTTLEEESNAGAMYAAARLPGDTTVAVEVGPVLDEYGTRLSADPIINTGDQKGLYSRSVVHGLMAAAQRAGYRPQAALLVDFASDASAVMSAGVAAQAGCLAIPTENTHGFEMIHGDGITACAATLVEYALAPQTPSAPHNPR
ncbi:M28 family peptidase [Pseudomonas guariconensis]|uniref:M28 family peptidase n=1 Tax=Pseudomonas guariconensis TaxID=1288410 RepID=UPI0025AA0CB5|nr:M28 family peptidase [Pseudomonas guariconensis]MDM9594564.1 M28 family peptidase [Pseudomonas guariconensis]MDM9607394.1 M28 family peptidase [Pseudomonas guariconensis]MDM9612350.1 M28 family peptidase [Pseudomonas guariconensis]